MSKPNTRDPRWAAAPETNNEAQGVPFLHDLSDIDGHENEVTSILDKNDFFKKFLYADNDKDKNTWESKEKEKKKKKKNISEAIQTFTQTIFPDGNTQLQARQVRLRIQKAYGKENLTKKTKEIQQMIGAEQDGIWWPNTHKKFLSFNNKAQPIPSPKIMIKERETGWKTKNKKEKIKSTETVTERDINEAFPNIDTNVKQVLLTMTTSPQRKHPDAYIKIDTHFVKNIVGWRENIRNIQQTIWTKVDGAWWTQSNKALWSYLADHAERRETPLAKKFRYPWWKHLYETPQIWDTEGLKTYVESIIQSIKSINSDKVSEVSEQMKEYNITDDFIRWASWSIMMESLGRRDIIWASSPDKGIGQINPIVQEDAAQKHRQHLYPIFHDVCKQIAKGKNRSLSWEQIKAKALRITQQRPIHRGLSGNGLCPWLCEGTIMDPRINVAILLDKYMMDKEAKWKWIYHFPQKDINNFLSKTRLTSEAKTLLGKMKNKAIDTGTMTASDIVKYVEDNKKTIKKDMQKHAQYGGGWVAIELCFWKAVCGHYILDKDKFTPHETST